MRPVFGRMDDDHDVDDTDSYVNLTDSEKGFLEELRSSVPEPSESHGKDKVDGERETISIVKHEEKVSELRERISKLESKVEKLNGEKTELRKSSDEFEERFRNKCQELEDEREVTEELRNTNSVLEGELGRLKRSQDPDAVSGRDHRILKEKYEDLEGELSGKDAEIKSLKESLQEASDRIEALEAMPHPEDAPVAVEEEPACADSEPAWSDAKVLRPSARILRSEHFTHPVYKVVLSRDGTTVSMVPDVEGGAVNRSGSIELPRLSVLVPFASSVEYPSKVFDDGSIIIELVDGL